MKKQETILAGFIRPIKIRLVQFPNSIKTKLFGLVNEKYFFRKNPIDMLKKTPAIDVKTKAITKINITLKKDTEISKVDFKKLMKNQSDFIGEALIEKEKEIKNAAFAKWKQNQKN